MDPRTKLEVIYADVLGEVEGLVTRLEAVSVRLDRVGARVSWRLVLLCCSSAFLGAAAAVGLVLALRRL